MKFRLILLGLIFPALGYVQQNCNEFNNAYYYSYDASPVYVPYEQEGKQVDDNKESQSDKKRFRQRI